MEQLLAGIILLMLGLHFRIEMRLTKIETKIKEYNGKQKW